MKSMKTLYGSRGTNTWLMEELAERIVRRGIHPVALATHRFGLTRVAEAYRFMHEGKCEKVAVVPEED